MVKNQENKTEIAQKNKNIFKFIKNVFFVFVLCGAVLWVWQNPDILQKIENIFTKSFVATEKNIKTSSEESQISLIKKEIAILRAEAMAKDSNSSVINQKEIDELRSRFETIEKTNLQVLDAKADASVVLGIIARLDKLEEKVDVLSRVTDDSALILTAVMMVKDTAERGGVFQYEAEILRQLAQNNLKVKEPIAVIEKVAAKGIKSNVYLVNKFNVIYKDIAKQQKADFEKTWKDRVNNKLNEFIQVRRTNQNIKEFETTESFVEVKNLVNEEDFEAAVLLLKRAENAEFVQKFQSLQNWMILVQNKIDFNDAIKQIANNSLAVMKVNSIKKEINND